MSSLYYYFMSYFYDDNSKELVVAKEIPHEEIKPKKFLISFEELNNVNLKPSKDVIPAPSRNMPLIDTFELNLSNKAQLDEILNIKLKPTIVNKKPTYYPPKNPVIKELNEKFGIYA